MKLGRFAFGTGSAKANRKSTSVSRKGRNGRPALVEPLEFRMLLSSTAATLAIPSSTTIVPDLVTPATASGAVTLLGNANPITSGESSPSFTNSTNFGDGAANGSEPISVTYTIENNVAGTLTMTEPAPVTISGAGAAYFKVTTQPGASVADGSSTTFTITFTPTTTGAENATVSIASSDSASPFTFAIMGTGTNGAVTLLGSGNAITSGESSPTPENFTDMGGTAPNSPLATTYTIQNNVGGTLTMAGSTPVTISGAGASFFKVTAQPNDFVADGSSTTFTITFTPTTTGFENATVSIPSSDLAGTFTFAIRGLGTTTGEIQLTGNSTYIASGDTSPNANDFTSFGVTDADGSLPLTRTYFIADAQDAGTLNLLGSNPVTISGPGAADYSVTTQPTSPVTPGIPVSFTITFTPITAGSENATVSIASSDPIGPFTFAIAGEGITMTAVGTGGLLIDTTEAGHGAGAADNQILDIEYAGYLTDGTLFDSSENAGRTPFQFELGVGQVIPGWDQGLLGMKIGESRTLIIPASLAYGSSGQGSIPPNATLIFNTTLLDIIWAQGEVASTFVAIPDGESSPSTTNATNFGTVTSTSAAPITNTYEINAFGGDLNLIFPNPAVSVSGSSAFTATQLVVNAANTQATFTVTYTPASNVSTAIVTLVNAIQGSSTTPADPNFTFTVQAQGPASDDGAATYSASTDDITGFAYNPSSLSTTDTIEVVISNGPTQTFLANEPSPELQSEFGTQSHDFTYAMPVLSVGTHAITIYAMDPTTNNTTLLATTSVTSQNSLFDDHYYLMENPDVAAAVAAGTFATGYDHYIQYGQFEGRSPSPYWDEAWYLKENPDVTAAVKAGTVSSGFMHYYLYGQYEGRGGLLYFNTSYYLQHNPDVAAAITAGTVTSAFEHFVLWGQYEGRAPMLYFSSTVYDTNNPDILPFVTGETLSSNFEQFIIYGQYEDRQPASNFYNNATYLADNPDVAAAVADGQYPDAFQQWLEYGQYEGRTAV
jgi:hypothetical protein